MHLNSIRLNLNGDIKISHEGCVVILGNTSTFVCYFGCEVYCEVWLKIKFRFYFRRNTNSKYSVNIQSFIFRSFSLSMSLIQDIHSRIAHIYSAETRPYIVWIYYHDITVCITYRLHAHVTNLSQCSMIAAHCTLFCIITSLMTHAAISVFGTTLLKASLALHILSILALFQQLYCLKKRDSCWPKGSWSYMSEVIDCGEDCGAERIWYSHRHWSLEQGQATVKTKQRTPETTVETLATFTLTMKGCGGRVFKQ